MHSVFDAVKSEPSLVPAVRTTGENGGGVDTLGYNSAKLVIAAGDIDTADGDETYAVKIEESDDNSGFSPVAGLETAITADNETVNIRIEGLGTSRKRYLRAVLDVGGTTPSIPCSAIFELGRAFTEPVQS